jgi:uncharacterized phiE125 gp8 family phage protein
MNDFYVVTTPPADDKVPVTLTEAKNHMRVETTVDDLLITSMIISATERLELHTNRVFIERTITGSFENLCASRFEKFPFIELRRAPVQSITSMTVTSAGTPSAFTDFTFKQRGGFPRLVFENTTPTLDDTTYPIQVVFVAGYGGQESVPQPIKEAIKSLVAFWYENRGDVEPDGGKGLPVEVVALLRPYRIVNTYG